jgi:hypothetical protein
VATATCRRASFLAESKRPRPRPRFGAALLLGLFLVLSPPGSHAARFELELGRLEHPVFAIEGLRVAIAGENEPAELAAARLAIGTHSWTNVRLRCATLQLREGRVLCRGGTLSIPGVAERWRVELELDPARRTGRLQLASPDGERLDVSLAPTGATRAELTALSLARVQTWLPELAAWQPAGRFDGRLEFLPAAGAAASGRIIVRGRLSDGRFSSADGLYAAEGVAIEIDAQAQPQRDGWQWRGRLAWHDGEAYLHPLYLTAGVTLDAVGHLESERVVLERAGLAFDGVRSVEATAVFDLRDQRLTRAALAVAEADLARIGPQFITPLLAPARADTLAYAGTASAGVRIEAGELVALDVALDRAGVTFGSGLLDIGPVSGVLPWQRHGRTAASLSVAQARWQKLAVGAFDVAARIDGESVSIDRIAIPVLDGRLVLSDLVLRRDASGWSGGGSAVVEPVSMSRLTEAVGLPVMAGVLSASLPGLRVRPGEVALDGALVISVFDGYLEATGLQLVEPFGVAPHLYADVTARNIDLAQLTDTFAFGSMTGFVDADIRGLELARWRPVRFDARLRSSPGRYPRRISQRAVQNISALGGPGAALAIQRGFLGFFESFGYREIGLSCRLAGGVCVMDGLPGRTANDGFVIIRGGGIPALNVIGYNRRVDWDELLNRLQRVIEANVAPVIE